MLLSTFTRHIQQMKILRLIIILSLLLIYLYIFYRICDQISWPYTSHPLKSLAWLPQTSLPKFSLRPNIDFCNNLLMISLVFIAPSDQKTRLIIRQTWGQNVNPAVKTVFLLGVNSSVSKASLSQEAALYGDLVQDDNYGDSYGNLTYKSQSGFYWATRFCSQAKFVMKIDSDQLIEIHKIVNLLKSVLRKQRAFEYFMIGRSFWSVPVQHRVDRKYYVSWEDYPHILYPFYMSGAFYILSQNLARKLVDTSLKRDLLFVNEDIYFTAFLTEGLPIYKHYLE